MHELIAVQTAVTPALSETHCPKQEKKTILLILLTTVQLKLSFVAA